MSDKYTINEFASLLRKKAEGQYDDWDDKQLVNKFIKKNPDYADWISESLAGSEPQVQTVMIPHTPDVGIQPRTPSGPDLGFGKGPSGFTLGTGVGFTGDMDVMQRDSSLRNFSQMLTELEIPAETWEKLSEDKKEEAIFAYERYKASQKVIPELQDRKEAPTEADKVISPLTGLETTRGLHRTRVGTDIRIQETNIDWFNEEARGAFTRALDTPLTDDQKKIVEELGENISLNELRRAEQIYQKIPEAENKVKSAKEEVDRLIRDGHDKPIYLNSARRRVRDAERELEDLRDGLNILTDEVKESIQQERSEAIEAGEHKGEKIGNFFQSVSSAAQALRQTMPFGGSGVAIEYIAELGKAVGGAGVSFGAQSYYSRKAMQESNPIKREGYLTRAHEFEGYLQGFELAVPDVFELQSNPEKFGMWATGQIGYLAPVVGSFMAASLAGGKTGGIIGSALGPKGTVAGTVIGSMAGGFLAGYESYKASMYWEMRKMGATHTAAAELAVRYAVPSALFSIAVPSAISSMMLGAFGKRYASNVLAQKIKNVGIASISESIGETLAQASVMRARELATGSPLSGDEWFHELFNTTASTTLMGGMGLMVPVHQAKTQRKLTPTEIDRYAALYVGVQGQISKPSRPILRAYMVERFQALDKQGILGEDGRKLLDHLMTAPMSEDVDIAMSLIDNISIGVVNRSDADNMSRLSELYLKEQGDILEYNEALELSSIIMNRPQLYDQFKSELIASSPSVQAYILQRAALSNVEISRKVSREVKAEVDAMLKIEDNSQRLQEFNRITSELDPSQIDAIKSYMESVESKRMMESSVEEYKQMQREEASQSATEYIQTIKNTDGSVAIGTRTLPDGSMVRTYVLSERLGPDGPTYIVKDFGSNDRVMVKGSEVSQIRKHTEAQMHEAYVQAREAELANYDQERSNASSHLSNIIRSLTPGSKVSFSGVAGYIYGVLNGEIYMIPEGGSISQDGVQIPLNKLSELEYLAPPTIESTEFVSQEVEVIDAPDFNISELENAYNQMFEDADVATVNVNKPVTKDGVELQPIPEGSRSGKPFDGWLYDTAKMFLDGTPEGAALIAQANRNKLSTFEREAMLEVLFGKGKVRLVEERMGQQNVGFFTGKADAASSDVRYDTYRPVLNVPTDTPVARSYVKFTDNGNFTGHISKMIPGFAEKQQTVAQAIVSGEFKSFLDIGTSEGGLIKAVGENRPDMRVVGVDPNRSMKRNFDQTPLVENVEYIVEAFMGEWTEDDGFRVNRYKPSEKFDVVNEDFTFQFINNNRDAQVREVKRLLNEGGLFVTSQKFHTENQQANERKKYDHQRKYFDESQLTEDKQTIVSGMDSDMVNDVAYFNTLKKHFKHVVEFWNAGNFKGYIASDNIATINQFIRDAKLENLQSEFTDVGSKTRDAQAIGLSDAATPTGEYIAFDMSEKKPSSRDDSNNISRQELNADVEGVTNLVHYSSSELEVIDPSRFGAQSHTTERRRLGGVSFYYQGDARPESGVGNIPHIVRVNADLIYPLTKDPMNLIPKIEQKIKEYSKKNMGGLEIGVSPETLMEFSQEVLSELGFIGAYADWSYLDNMKRRVDGKRVELWKEQKVDRATTDSRRRFMVIRPSARDAMATMKHEIYNNIQQNLQRHPNKNEILPRFYSLEKQGVRALVNDEVISQYISKDLIEEYNRWAAVNDFVSVETSPLTNTQWAVLTAWNPGKDRLSLSENKTRNEKLIARIREMGYDPVMQKGMYDAYEENIFVPGMTTEQAIELGKEFGQESILSPEGLVYQDGTVNPADLGNIVFNQRADNYYSQIEIEGVPVKYQVSIDFNTSVPLAQAQQLTENIRQQMRENLDQLDMSMDAANDYTGDQIKELIPDTKIVDIEGYPLMVEASIPVDGISADNVMNVPIGDSGGNINVFLNIINPVFNDPSLTHISFKELSDRIGREQAMEILMAVEEAIYESEAWGEFVEEFGTLQHLLEGQYSEQLHVDAATLFQDAYVLEVLKREGYDGVVFAGTNMEASTEYRVFDVSQIIDSQTGKPIDSGEGSFAIAGERGAQALDQISQATTRMDNLAVARSMESDGKSAKAIRLATGWEKGADGKWRYEILDGRIIDKYMVPHTASHLGYDGIIFEGNKSLIPIQRDNPYDGLQFLYDNNELFSAYPNMKRIRVYMEVNRAHEGNAHGSYYLSDTGYETIEVYAPDMESARSVLTHEIQHAIQVNEQFAKGGDQFSVGMKAVDALAELENTVAKAREQVRILKEFDDGTTHDVSQSVRDSAARMHEQSIKDLRDAEQALEDLKKVIEEDDGSVITSSNYNLYRRLSGEVEARNVQTRMMMTPEERINTLLRDTEDIAREDQLIMMDMLGKPENLISHESIISMLFKNNLNARTAAEVLGQKHKDIQDAIEGIQSYENKRRRGINMDKVTDEMVIRVADYVGPIVFESIRGDMKNAIGWYSFDIEVAMEAASEIFPEIKTDKKAELVYKILLAITSPAATPYNNANLANSIMRYWLDNGKFPKANTKGVKFGVRVNTVVPNLVKISELFDKMSVDQAWEFLKNEQTREQFAEYGYTFTSPPYGAGTPVPGGAIFGAKVGGEFLASFLGNTNWGTMDMWMSRFIQMFLGQNPKGAASRGTKTTNLQGLRARIREQKDPWTIPAPLDPSIVMTVRKPKGINTKSDILKNNANLLAYAEAVDNAYAKTEDSKGNKHSKEFRDGSVIPGVLDSKGKEVTGSLVEISRRVKSNHNPGETPQNKGRQILQRAFQIIRERGKGMGYDLTAPDIQAILWYFTKDTLEQAGYRPEPADTYSNALIEILKRNDNPKWEQYQIMKDKALAEKLKQSVKTPEGVSYFDMLSKAAQVKTDKDVTMGRIHSELVLLNMLSNEGGKVVIARNSQELMNAMAEQGETATSINDVAAKSPVLYINGMFSERTGVTYYNLEDMYLTGRSPLGIFLHEQGVHAGLKKLIPDQLKRNAFLTKLFNDLGGDSFMAQVFPSQRVYKEYRKNLPDHAVAEEYLARIAEKISADQILSQTERNAWQRFVDSIVDFIEKVLNRQVRITPKGAEAVALAAARTIIGEGAPARSQRISELGDILTPPDKMTVINPAGMKDGGKFSDGMIMMDIADKKPSSDQQGKNPLQIIEELQEQLKAARMEKGVTALKTIAKEKGKQAARRTIVEDFIRENRKMLQAINPGRIPSSLNKVLKAARSDKSLDGAIAGLKAAILEGQKTQARRMADDFARKLGRLKTETKSGGIMKAKLLLQEGVDYVESVRGILAMTKEEVSDAMIQIEKTIEGYEEVLSNREGDLEVMELLSNAEAMYNLLDMYGDLRNKPLDQVINAIEAMNVDMQDMKEKFKASRDAERVRRMEMIDGVAQDVGGDPTISDSYFADIVKQSERTGPGWTQRYQAMHGTIASLSHAIWRGYKQGQRSKEFFNSKLFRLYKDVDNAISAKISMQEQMKAHLNEMMQDITLMKQKEFAKYMEEEHVVTLEVKTKDMAEDSYREKKISLKLGNLLHIWLSYQSEANKGYMDRVQMGDVKLRITERTFQEISKILDSSVDHRLITDFAIWLMTDYFGSNEYYSAVNEVVTRKIGRRLSSLQDYIPVIATSNRNTVDVDMSNFGIFKSIVKERRGGEYHLDKNNIWDVAIKYADDVSSMVHLAEPVSDFYYTLNSYPVRVATKAQQTHHKVEAILDLLEKGYTGYTDKYAFLYETLLRRFRGSKILMNYSLLPKQITSLVAALDSDFGNPSGIATEMMAFLSGQGDKEIRGIVMEIAKAHADVRYRNMMDIESLTQKKERAVPKVNIRMFGEKPANMAMGVVATFLWNPTVVGDLVPVYVGGIPIAVHNYKAGLKMAESMGLKGGDAKNFAAQRAMDMMTEFINTTQQSSKWTHRAQFQYGGYRVMTSFMNALMGYSRKTTRHARDIGRDYKAAVARYIDEGADADTASMRALADIPPSKLAALFTYTTVLPLFFSAVGHWGMNWFRMFSEDDEERRRSRWQMVYDALIAWTKGMFGIGFVLELGFNKSQDINYGPKMDNVIPILDDVMDIADGLRRIVKVMRDNNDELIKTKSEYEQRLYSAIKDTVNPLQGVLAGGSMVMVDRIFDVIMNEGYGDLAKAVARIYGISERDMQWFFDGDPLSQIDPDVAEFYDEGDEFNSYQVGKYLSEMRARHEMVGTPFDERMYLNKFLAHRQIDAVNDPDARLTLNVLLSGWGARKKAEWFANRYERYSDVISFRNEMISPFDHSYMEWTSNTNPERESALPPIMSAGLKDQIAERIALNISRSKLDTEEKIKQIDSLKSLDLSENQILRLNERIKSLQE